MSNTTNQPKRKRLNPYIGEERIKWLEEEAKKLEISVSDLLRRIIDEYRKKEGKE